MPRYKRTRDEAGLDLPAEPEVPPEKAELLSQLRNMWEFASFMQYIFLFGEVVKIDNDLDIEDLEAECLKPIPSEKLPDIGLALLKFVSSHRGLTLEIFEEYTRRQYLAKAPQRNPFGDEEEPTKFNDLDVFTRIRVLQQLSTWTLGNADRIRGLMSEEEDNTNWRMEPLGWDKEDRSYFVLDDNRLYRRTDEPPPPPTPKLKPKRKPARKSNSRATRASKRRKIEESSEDEAGDTAVGEDGDAVDDTVADAAPEEDEAGFGFTAKTWECVAITLDDYQEFMSTIFRSRDPNEKQLRARIEADVVPIIEKRAEALKQKQFKRVRELENLQRMATAKRSSRLADKAEKEKQEREEREVEEKRQLGLKMAFEEQERQKRIEEGHESRRLTREQRLRERESKRILHEEELAKLEQDAERDSSQEPADSTKDGGKRVSNRQLQSQREQHKLELERLAEEDGKWFFDCAVCGVHGENLDDGTHSIACDRCNVWQHSKCHGLTKQQAERDDFSFVCSSCKQKEGDTKKPRSPTLKFGKDQMAPVTRESAPATNGHALPEHVQRQLDGVYVPHYADLRTAGPFGQLTGQLPAANEVPFPLPGFDITIYPPVGNFAPHATRPMHQSPPQQAAQPERTTGQPSSRPGSAHAWHPNAQHQTNLHQSPPPQWQAPYSHPGAPPGQGGHPPAPVNGYGPPPSPHHQHHSYAHQHAVASSGGHPVYYGSYHGSPPPAMPYPPPPQPPPGMMVVTQTIPHMYFPQAQQPQQKPPKGPGPSKRLMVFHSPPEKHARPASSSPTKERTQASPQATPAQSSPKLQHSPRTNLPPPTTSSRPEIVPSPVKSSSSPPHPPAPASSARAAVPSPSPNPPVLTTSSASSTHTPFGADSTTDPALRPLSSASKLVADGMSGPWPESSSAIPQKHDPSSTSAGPPASSSSSSSERNPALATVPPLAPSPRQRAEGEMGTIPVKKIPGAKVD